jgi:hypothetical protein
LENATFRTSVISATAVIADNSLATVLHRASDAEEVINDLIHTTPDPFCDIQRIATHDWIVHIQLANSNPGCKDSTSLSLESLKTPYLEVIAAIDRQFGRRDGCRPHSTRGGAPG